MAPDAENPALHNNSPLAVMVPLAVNHELVVSLLPALIVILLNDAVPLRALKKNEFAPPNVVVLFPGLRNPSPSMVKSPVIVKAAFGVNKPVIRTSLKVFDPVPVTVVVSLNVVVANDVKVPLTDKFPDNVASARILDVKDAKADTVSVPATKKGKSLATRDAVAETIKSSDEINPWLAVSSPSTASTPPALNGMLKATSAPELILMVKNDVEADVPDRTDELPVKFTVPAVKLISPSLITLPLMFTLSEQVNEPPVRTET